MPLPRLHLLQTAVPEPLTAQDPPHDVTHARDSVLLTRERHGGGAQHDFAAGSSDQSRRPPPVPRIPAQYRQQPGGQSEQALGVQSRRAKLIYWGERY